MIAPRLSLLRFLRDEEGGTALEYGLICSLIFLAIIGAVTLVAARTTTMWSSIASHI
jgi:pilus assembly protein Flp/PilA